MSTLRVSRRGRRFLVVGIAAAVLLVSGGHAGAWDKNGAQNAKFILDQIKHKVGPCHVDLGSQAAMDVPAGFAFIEEAQMAEFAKITQNTHSPRRKGTLIELKDGWFVVFSFEDIGYVKDEDKNNLKPDELLESLRKNQEEDNKQRKAQNISTLTIAGWAKPPFFDEDTKNLTWALNIDSPDGANVNYESRILGRRGVMTATLVMGPDEMKTAVPQYNEIIKKNYTWKSGESYAEFKQGDHVAEYGLAALIAGGTAAALVKSGWLVKFLKPIIVGVIAFFAAIGSFFKKLFGRGQSTAS